MKYSAKQLSNGNWAVFAGKRYFTSSETADKQQAEIEAIHRSGCWYEDQIRKCNEWLEANDPNYDPSDPRAYLA